MDALPTRRIRFNAPNRSPLAAAVDAVCGEIVTAPAANDDECIALDDADLLDVESATA